LNVSGKCTLSSPASLRISRPASSRVGMDRIGSTTLQQMKTALLGRFYIRHRIKAAAQGATLDVSAIDTLDPADMPDIAPAD
jgi:hypothetical protein